MLPDHSVMPAMPTMPVGACNAHMHIYDLRFAHTGPDERIEPRATVDDYLPVRQRLGLTRTVVVTPRNYATDNRVTLDAIQRLGAQQTRGVAVLRPEVTDAELHTLHEGGIRGIRFTLYRPEHAVVAFDMVETLASRVQPFGWHLQLHWTADQVVEHRPLIERLAVPLVFDHLGRLPLPQGTAHPAFAIMRRRVDEGRGWVKLSGPYLDSLEGVSQDYRDVDPIARAWVDAAPDRLVWGSDWPHSTESSKPDDADLLAMLSRWADDDKVRKRILVDNPAQLYGF
jgi:D-galactarolactone isomerase